VYGVSHLKAGSGVFAKSIGQFSEISTAFFLAKKLNQPSSTMGLAPIFAGSRRKLLISSQYFSFPAK